MKLVKSSLALAIVASFFTQTSYAVETVTDNNDIEVITVTGDFRQTNLQQTPSSFSVLSAQDSDLRNAQNLEELIAIAPNVNFSSGSQRARYYQIRGIGERSQFQEPINPSVGIIIDDVDFTGIGSVASTFDVAQTEIFRGPQGTRFGANALAGLINITTNNPTDEFEGGVKLTAGNYNSYGAGITLSGPATEKVNYRLAVEQYQSDGFIENTYLHRDDTNNRDELSIRAKLAIEATNDLFIDLTMFHFDFDNGYDAFSLDNNRETFSDEPGFDTQETTAMSAKFRYQGFNDVELISILSYADSDLGYGYDEDWSNATLCLENDCPYGDYSSTDHYFRDRNTVTAELRIQSKAGAELFNGSTEWVTGVYLKQDDEELTRQYTYLESGYASSFDTDTYAVFVQFDSELSEKLSLTTGLRVEKRSADFANTDQLHFDPTDTMVGGKAVLAYQQNEDTLIYGSINRGYKTGGVNTDGTLPDELREFEPEYVWNYEMGYKVSLLDNQAFIRAAIFYMDRDDIQVKSSKDVLRPDGSSEFIIYLGNAATGYNQGIEIESAWQINDEVEIYGSLGLLDTEFDNFTNANGENLSGREQAHAPNYQFNVGVNYHINDNWLFNLSVDGKDEFYFSDSHEQISDSVELVNASINYLQNNWQVKVWARNLLDEDYATRGFYFGNDPRDGYTAKAYHQLAEPAVFGATLNYQF